MKKYYFKEGFGVCSAFLALIIGMMLVIVIPVFGILKTEVGLGTGIVVLGPSVILIVSLLLFFRKCISEGEEIVKNSGFYKEYLEKHPNAQESDCFAYYLKRENEYEEWEKDALKRFHEGKMKREEEEKKKRIEAIQEDRRIHKPKCPTCGSERVHPISNLDRVLDTSGFGTIAGGGLNSKTLGKSYICDNCQYRW